jgi:hypothetical protein
VRYVKSKRMAWLGHVMRMEGERIPKRVLEWKPMGRRNRRRPRKGWIEDTEKDIQISEVSPCYCSATLTEVFPCFFLSCTANARV